jgi:hypothetical protein
MRKDSYSITLEQFIYECLHSDEAQDRIDAIILEALGCLPPERTSNAT